MYAICNLSLNELIFWVWVLFFLNSGQTLFFKNYEAEGREASKQTGPFILFLWVQVDRSKKPSTKIPDDQKAKAESPAIVKPLNSNGKLVPDRSTKPSLDTKPSLTDEERSPGHMRKATAVEKNEGEKEEPEEEREVQRRERAEERAREDHGDWEGRENLRRYKEDQEKKEKEQPAKGVDQKQDLEKVPRDSADVKKKSIAGSESPEMRKADLDKNTASEKEKIVWTPETQRRSFAEESQGPLRGDSGLNKVSGPAAT